MCFLFAQKYHPAMRYVGAIRRELGFRTVFNILGALTNPARPAAYLLGVYDGYLVEPIAKVLCALGVRRAFVVYGQDKMDEVSLSAPTTVCELREGYYRTSVVRPEDFGFARCQKSDLLGGTPQENAATVHEILEGREFGSKRDAAVLNAGFALVAAGLARDVAEGVQLASELVANGEAAQKLAALIEESNA
jgi:anthranilate phosphoribosyltransferase